MTLEYTLNITFELPDPEIEVGDNGIGPSREWKAAVSGSVDEFGEDLRRFLDRHPMVKACNYVPKKS